MPSALGSDRPDVMNNTQRKMEVDELFAKAQLAYLLPEIAHKTRETVEEICRISDPSTTPLMCVILLRDYHLHINKNLMLSNNKFTSDGDVIW